MSPKTHRVHVPRADNIGQSNTTANLFLGGVRRNWMGPEGSGQIRARQLSDLPTSGSEPPRAEPLMSPADTLPFPRPSGFTTVNSGFAAVNARNPDPRVTALPSPVPSTNSPSSPVGSNAIVQPSTAQQIQRGNVGHMRAALPGEEVLRSQPIIQNPVVGAQRVVTPQGTTTTGSPSGGQHGDARQTPSALPSTGHLQSRTQSSVVGTHRETNPRGTSTTALGSDGPGNTQQTPSTLHSNGDVQSRTQSPFVGAQRDINPQSTPTTVPASAGQRGVEEQPSPALPQDISAQGQPATQSPLVGVRLSADAQGIRQTSEQPPGQSQDVGTSAADTGPDGEQWDIWLNQLDILVAELNEKKVLTGHVGLPRVDLLRQAILRKDTFYLAMHQLFCRSSIDPTTLGFLGAPEDGFRMLARLLEDNEKMDYAVTLGFSHFPSSPQSLILQPWYYKIVAKVPLFLKRLAGEWEGMYTQSFRPPLVDELRDKFTVDSPILMAVMFMCISRGLYEEQYIKRLLQLFWNDWASFKSLLEHRITETSRRATCQYLTREYLKYPKVHAPSQSPQIAQVTRPHSSQVIRSPQAAQPHRVSQSPQTSQSPQMPHPPQVTQATQVQYPNPSAPYPGLQVQTMQQPVPVSSPRMGSYVGNPAYSQPPASSVDMTRYHQTASNSPQAQSSPTGYIHPPGWHPQLQQVAMQAARPQQRYPSQIRHAMAQAEHMRAFGQAPVRTPPALAPISSTYPSSAAPTQPSRPASVNSAHPQIASQPHVQHTQQQRQSLPAPTPPLPQRDPSISYFLPPPDYRAPMTVNPVPMRLGLHQANLRDPIKKLLTKGTDGQDIETTLSCFLAGSAIPPTVLAPQTPMYGWAFNVTDPFFKTLPHMASQKVGQRPIWTYRSGCNTLRLRSIRLPGTPTSCEEQWPIENTYWPSVIYIHVNDKEMFVRRKVHNGKDLPLDITANIRPGRNTVKVTLLLGQDECKNSRYAMGVEVLRICDFETIKNMAQYIPAEESRALLQKRLNPTSDDDELAVVTDSLTISLVDPFMARIFDIPARSRNCTHFDCFDLDTFIKTRMFECDDKPMIENWRCPTCKKDARPQFLVIDQFLAEVHANLARTNRLEGAEAIQFKADGSWTLKEVFDEQPPKADRARLPTKRKADSTPGGQGGSRPKTEVTPSVTPMNDQTVIELD